MSGHVTDIFAKTTRPTGRRRTDTGTRRSDLRRRLAHPRISDRHRDTSEVAVANAGGALIVSSGPAGAFGTDQTPAKLLTVKRVFDVGVASLALVFLAPLFCLIAVSIKSTSRGPVFFRQVRHGLNGQPIRIWKFRTMYFECCDKTGIKQTEKSDPRVTPVGRFLRRSNFDELPQLLNVVTGDMSLVGPRPHVPGMLAAGVPYEEFDPRYMSRHRVRPGLTGLAQMRGFRGETTSVDAARNRLNSDLEYIYRRSFWMDVKIMLGTVRREFFSGHGY